MSRVQFLPSGLHEGIENKERGLNMLAYIMILYLMIKISTPMWVICVCSFAIGVRLISWSMEENKNDRK